MGLFDRAAVHRGISDSDDGARGLLRKAASRVETFSEEGMEAACIERVLRLAEGESAPYTSLSLIKAFFPFLAGLCLELQGDTYECYASIGVEKRVRLEKKKLSFDTDGAPLKIGTSGSFDIACASPVSECWLFPLDESGDFRFLLLFVEEPGTIFPCASLERVVKSCKERLTPPHIEMISGNELRSFVEKAVERSSRLQFIVLEGKDDAFAQRVKVIASSIGSTIEVGRHRILIILSPTQDRELIAHQLAKSLKVNIIADAETDGLERAFEFAKALAG